VPRETPSGSTIVDLADALERDAEPVAVAAPAPSTSTPTPTSTSAPLPHPDRDSLLARLRARARNLGPDAVQRILDQKKNGTV